MTTAYLTRPHPRSPLPLRPRQGQPTPEVLYLCTTCGGTLRDGEDGRWRRRRRPSSAPAAGRRKEENWTLGRRLHGDAVRAGAGGLAPGEDGGLFWAASREEDAARVNGASEETMSKLRYACSARRIQHAYYDFRHRQYLRDWAFSLVRVFSEINNPEEWYPSPNMEYGHQ